jgi:anti-sigma B factor antagonist
MTVGTRAIVKQLPEKLSHPLAYRFLQDLQPLLRTNRSYLVFDFSQVCEIDSAGIGVLLRCLEEAMKGNGDIKLAAVPPETEVILELTGVDRLFEIFDTTSAAVESFRTFSVGAFGRTELLQDSSSGLDGRVTCGG